MIRELFHIGSFSVSPFGVMLVLAFLASYLQLRWGMKRLGIGDEEDASALVFAAGLGGIVGAKVYYAILFKDWHLLFDRSGLVWYGGFILGAIGVLWTMRRRRLPGWPMADVAAPALALGYGIGRIGCFLVGDDYGRPTDLPWGSPFPSASRRPPPATCATASTWRSPPRCRTRRCCASIRRSSTRPPWRSPSGGSRCGCSGAAASPARSP